MNHYGAITKSLTELLKKETQFCWNKDAQIAFQLLEAAMAKAPVLRLLD